MYPPACIAAMRARRLALESVVSKAKSLRAGGQFIEPPKHDSSGRDLVEPLLGSDGVRVHEILDAPRLPQDVAGRCCFTGTIWTGHYDQVGHAAPFSLT